MTAARQGGFTLVEVVVAMLIFALGAAALAQTLVMTQHLRAATNRWLGAVQLAERQMERLRTGANGADDTACGALTCRIQVTPDDAARLDRLEVSVAWQDGGAQQAFVLTSLRRQTP